ncbi:MAG: hypothetical protein KBB75_02255 [Candidatus Pacebacteria bacterium]|jgi:hypothetical protein|nr:hypothetical protein [Candidatus Paceibacterota bacterium]
MKTIQKGLILKASFFLVVLLSLVWLGVDCKNWDSISLGIILTIVILANIFIFALLGERFGQGDYLLMENIKKGTCFKVISSLEIPKDPDFFYVIELQNGNFSILSLKCEKKKEHQLTLEAGKSYFINSQSGKLLMV